LIINDEISNEYLIKGIVTDSNGLPMSNVNVEIYNKIMNKGERRFNESYTKNDGQFKIKVFNDITYTIKVIPFKRNNKLYVADNKLNIKGGDYITINVIETNGLLVDLAYISDEYNYSSFKYDAWLENDQKQRIDADRVILDGIRVYFAGVPEIECRVVILTERQEYYYSPIIKTNRNKLINTEVVR